MRLSIVVPVYNEKESLVEFFEEIAEALDGFAGGWEVIFIDDGSTDGSWAVLLEIARFDSRVRLVRLVRNYGKSAAYMAGFAEAHGELIATLDADLQDDPGQLSRLLRAMEQYGYDLVIGWKHGRDRNEPLKTYPSRLYNRFKGRIFGLTLRDSNSGFRLMRREVAEALDLYGDHYRFIPELAHRRGFRVGETRVKHRPRLHGQSKYGPMRFWTGLLDVASIRFVTLYAPKPLHFFGRVSLIPFGIGVALELYVLVQKFVFASTFQTHLAALIIGVMFIMIGVQLLGTGLVCEMLAAQRHGPGYHIREKVGPTR